MPDRFDCYELCVQSPRHEVNFLRAVHGNEPVVLREDFCGTAAVSRRWASDALKRDDDGRAVAIDLDAETIGKARGLATAAGVAGRIAFEIGDAVHAEPFPIAGADIIFVGNFSIGYIHRRADLLHYLRQSKARLDAGNSGFGGGIFACDTYGGAGAFRLGGLERKYVSPDGYIVHYAWAHDAANPMTAIVENSISFRVEHHGEVTDALPRAFTYRWRLWSIPELREAMADAGFTSTAVHTAINVAPGEQPQPVDSPEALQEDWIVLIVAK